MQTPKLWRSLLRGEPIRGSHTRAVILAVAILMFLPLLSFVEIYNVGEGREGTVVQEIIKSGNWILPLRNGEIVPSKPILYHWLAVVPAFISGEVGSWEIRLPSAIAGIGTVWVVFWLLNSTLNTGAATIGALILLTTEGFVAVSTEGRVDSVFSFFVVSAIALALRGIVQAHTTGTKTIPSHYVLLSSITCGLAVLAKGPIAWVLTGLVVIGLLLLFQGGQGLRQLFRPELLLAIAIPLPWYLAATLQGGDDFLARQLMYENVRRFTGGDGITGRSIWYYPNRLFVFAAPWGFLLPLIGIWKVCIPRTRPMSPPADLLSRYLCRAGAMWLFLPIAFFSLASGKHNAYLMPVLPGLSIMLAVWINSGPWNYHPSAMIDRLGVLFTWSILIIGPLLLLLIPFLHPHLHSHAALISEFFVDAISPRAGTVLALYLGGSAITWMFVCTRHHRTGFVRQWGPILIGILCICLGVYVRVGRAVKGWLHGDRPLAQQILKHVADTETINWVLPRGSDEKLGVGRDDSFDTVFFHINRHVKRLDTSGLKEQPGLYIARRSWVEEQPASWRGQIRIRAEGGKRDDQPQERVWIFDLLPAAPPTSTPSLSLTERTPH